MINLLAFLFWLIPSIAGASVLSDAAASLAVGQWVEISTNNIADALVDTATGGTQHRIPYAEGMHWDPASKRGYAFSSDDPGDSKEAIYYDEATNAWGRVSNDPWGAGRAHQYDAMGIDLINRRIYNVGGDGSASWSMDLGTRVFTSRGAVPTSFEDAEGGAFFCEMNAYVQLDAGAIHKLDGTTLTWTGTIASVPSGTTTFHSFAEYNERHHIVLFGGGSNSTQTFLYKLDAAGTVTRLTNAPTSLEVPRMEMVVDPATGKFLVLRSNGTFWEYEVRTDSWVSLSTAAIPAQIFETSDPNQLNTIGMAIPEYGVIFWVNCEFTSCTTWLYRHAKSLFPNMPSVCAEKAAYKNKLGWAWTSGDEPNIGNQSSYTVANVDNHDDVEADDLWNNIMMFRRTGQNGYKQRADAWARYDKDDYLQCVGTGQTYCYDRDNFLADHVKGKGLVAYYEWTGNSAYLTAAENIAATVETRAASVTPGSTRMCYYECRKWGRHLELAVHVANANPISRWITLRNTLIDAFIQSPDWDSRGMYFASEEATDAQYGAGAYAGGRRMQSAFQVGIACESHWQAYLATGRADLKSRIVSMATYVRDNGLHPTYQYTASRIGFQGVDPWWNYNFPVFTDSVYTIALTNCLVMGYKLTGVQSYLDAAITAYNRGSKGPIGGGLPDDRTAPDNEVYKFVDAVVEPDGFYFGWNKGGLQYSYLLFENGGNPTILSLSTTGGALSARGTRKGGSRR